MIARGIVCVFAKPPVPGQVKTRLAAQIGENRAAELARAFLQDTWTVASSIADINPVLATTGGAAADFGLPGDPEIWFQGEGDLGKRLERILTRGLAEADFVIAIGADNPGLPAGRLAQAAQALSKSDAVLGPADDGGFYLIALRRCPPRLFEGLPWSAPTTFLAMKERLEALSMTLHILERWFDIDRVDDLDRFRSMIVRGEVNAQATALLL